MRNAPVFIAPPAILYSFEQVPRLFGHHEDLEGRPGLEGVHEPDETRALRQAGARDEAPGNAGECRRTASTRSRTRRGSAIAQPSVPRAQAGDGGPRPET